jgi:hypothetical protein
MTSSEGKLGIESDFDVRIRRCSLIKMLPPQSHFVFVDVFANGDIYTLHANVAQYQHLSILAASNAELSHL